MRRLNFIIKKGVYCTWCADLMRRTLKNKFHIEKVEFDMPQSEVKMLSENNLQPSRIIAYLRKRGFYLSEQYH